MNENLSTLEGRTGHVFASRALLLEALTHRSYACEHGLPYDNQRLEFLGDSVAGLIASEMLYEACPQGREGMLTEIRASLVSRRSFAAFARSIDLGSYLRLGKGEDTPEGRARESTLGDAFEALVGAVFLDGGHSAAKAALGRFFQPGLAELMEPEWALNPKGALQEHAQSDAGLAKPVYEVIGVSGPEHALQFEIRVLMGGVEAGRGFGTNKKAAEKNAALDALRRLKADGAVSAPRPVGSNSNGERKPRL